MYSYHQPTLPPHHDLEDMFLLHVNNNQSTCILELLLYLFLNHPSCSETDALVTFAYNAFLWERLSSSQTGGTICPCKKGTHLFMLFYLFKNIIGGC